MCFLVSLEDFEGEERDLRVEKWHGDVVKDRVARR